jgi:hypothetical protein
MTYRPGDRVTITNPSPENAKYRGKAGTALDDGSKSGGLIAVKGLDGRLKEAVAGFRGFYADELTRA